MQVDRTQIDGPFNKPEALLYIALALVLGQDLPVIVVKLFLDRGDEHEGLKAIIQDWLTPPWALHCDNGSEFINVYLLRFCQDNKLSFTRSRPYQKNDNLTLLIIALGVGHSHPAELLFVSATSFLLGLLAYYTIIPRLQTYGFLLYFGLDFVNAMALFLISLVVLGGQDYFFAMLVSLFQHKMG